MKNSNVPHLLKNLSESQLGAAALEFALFLPILILLSLAGLNVSRYILFEGSVSKTADTLANIITMSRPYTDKIDIGRVTDTDDFRYLDETKIRAMVNTNAPLLLNNIDENDTKIIVTSLRGDPAGGAVVIWREVFEYGAADSLGESVLDKLATTDGTCVGLCEAARNMLPSEGMVSVEIYQEFNPFSSAGSNIPIGKRTVYSGAGYSPRFGVLNCLYPRLSPYDGSC